MKKVSMVIALLIPTLLLADEPPYPNGGHPCICGCDVTGKCDCPSCNAGCGFPTYQKAKVQALSTGQPMVTFIGFEPPGSTMIPNGMIATKMTSLTGYSTGDVVISVPEDGKMWHYATVRSGRIFKPKRVMVGCETGKCTPTYFPPQSTVQAGFQSTCPTCPNYRP